MPRKTKGLRRIEPIEADILKVCCDYLDAKKIFYIRHSPSNIVGGGKSEVAFRRPRASQLGAPDLIVFQDYSKKDHIGFAYSAAIEVKTKTGQLSPDQKKWKKRADKVGLDYFVVRSLEDLQATLR